MDGVFGKGKLVLAVVQDYCSKNECTFDELKAAFPDEAQGGNTGVFGTLLEAQEIAKKRARHYVNVVCNAQRYRSKLKILYNRVSILIKT